MVSEVAYCTKVLTVTNTKCRLAWPTKSVGRLLDLNHGHQLDFLVVDKDGAYWRFHRAWRKGGRYRYLKPVVSGDWLRFVKMKDLKEGDEVRFYEHNEFPKVFFTIVTVKKLVISPL